MKRVGSILFCNSGQHLLSFPTHGVRSCTLKVNSGAQQVWPDLCTGIWLDLTCELEGRGSLAAWMRVENATPIWIVAAHAQQFRTSHPTACHVENLGCCSTCPYVRCFWLASSELGVIELVPESNPATLRRVNGPHALLVGQGRCAYVLSLLPNLTLALYQLPYVLSRHFPLHFLKTFCIYFLSLPFVFHLHLSLSRFCDFSTDIWRKAQFTWSFSLI